MAKVIKTRRSKMLKSQGAADRPGERHKGLKRQSPEQPATLQRGQQAKSSMATKDKSQLGRSSPATRGKTHGLSSSGRKTTARTQGGARKGGGRDHDF